MDFFFQLQLREIFAPPPQAYKETFGAHTKHFLDTRAYYMEGVGGNGAAWWPPLVFTPLMGAHTYPSPPFLPFCGGERECTETFIIFYEVARGYQTISLLLDQSRIFHTEKRKYKSEK